MLRDDDTLGLVLLGGGIGAASTLAWRAHHRANASAGDTAQGASDEAQARLSEIRSQLGLGPSAAETAADTQQQAGGTTP